MRHTLRNIRTAATGLAALLLVACGGGGTPAAYEMVEPRVMETEPYRLDTGDSVLISVADVDELQDVFEVDAVGVLDLPAAGPINVRGRTVQDLADDLDAKLRGVIVAEPIISVEAAGFRAIYVSGDIRSPGRYRFVDGVTIAGIVDQAGGSTHGPDGYIAHVVRAGTWERLAVGTLEASDPVFPGDAITIERREIPLSVDSDGDIVEEEEQSDT